MKFAWLLVIVIPYLRICFTKDPQMQTVWSRIGDKTELPCNLPHFKHNDKAILYLWFKDSNPESVYSFDARSSSPSKSHWYDEKIFGRRASFDPDRGTPMLILDQLKKSDEGIYTCRVEFKRSPSSFTTIVLSIVDAPDAPEVLYEGSTAVGTIGPLFEGEQIEVTCRVKGGKPKPHVDWWVDSRALPSKKDHQTVGGVTYTFAFVSVTADRSFHRASLICRTYSASPSNGSTSVVQSVVVHLNITLSPISIKLTGLENPISDRTTVYVECRVEGSSPPSQVTLFKGDVPLTDTKTALSDGGNVSIVTTTIHVTKEDNGKTIVCRGTNPVLEEQLQLSSLTDIAKLNVFYSPVVNIELNKNMKILSLKEGQDALLQCIVKANPPPHRIDWFKDSKALKQNGKYIIATTDLALQKLDRSHSGAYFCTAENLEGRGTSPVRVILVKYAPVCASREHHTQGTAIGHSTNISCQVEANPSDNVTFSWSRIHTTGRAKNVPESNFTSNGLSSTLTAHLAHIEEFGNFFCTASNSIGRQAVPCMTTLVPAGPPYPPEDCSSLTDGDSLAISCDKNFNGGLPQKFFIEIFENSELLYAVSNEVPVWSVGGLEGGKELDIVVWAGNTKGKSSSVKMFVQMPTANQQSVTVPEDSKNSFDTATLYGAILGTLLVITACAVAIVCVIFRRFQKNSSKETKEVDELQSINAHSPDVVNSVQERPRSAFIDFIDHNQGTTFLLDKSETLHISQSSSSSSFESDSDTWNARKVKILKLHLASETSSLTGRSHQGHVSDDGTVHAYRSHHTLDRNYRRPRLKKQVRNSVLELASDRDILELLLQRSSLKLSTAKESAV